MQNLEIFTSAEETRTAVATAVTHEIDRLLRSQPAVHIALTGGTDGSEITDQLDLQLRSINAPESSIHIWWSDERFVELNDSQRNDLQLINLQTSRGINPAFVVHRAPTPSQVGDMSQAVEMWETDFGGAQIDVAIVGVGPDGHIASLFPGQWNKTESDDFLAITDSPKPPAHRLSMSFRLLSQAKHIIIAGTSDAKAPIFGAAVSKDFELPITHLLDLPQSDLYLDSSAAAQIKTTSAHLTTENS